MDTQLKRLIKEVIKTQPQGPLNSLVQYKGGGYDGCHWEWNYFYFDSKGRFHDIASSGRNGIDQEQAARDILKDKSNSWDSVKHYTYKVTSSDDVQEFCNESAESHVNGCGIKINQIENKALIHWECSDCEEKFYPMSDDCYDGAVCSYQGYHGIGGIAVQHDGPLCVDCTCSNSCTYCGEYVGTHDNDDWSYNQDREFLEDIAEKYNQDYQVILKESEKHDENYGPLCKYCLENHLSEKFSTKKAV